jgi:hypothetical protein
MPLLHKFEPIFGSEGIEEKYTQFMNDIHRGEGVWAVYCTTVQKIVIVRHTH